MFRAVRCFTPRPVYSLLVSALLPPMLSAALVGCGGGDAGPTEPNTTSNTGQPGENWDFRPAIYADEVLISSQALPGLHALTGTFNAAGPTVAARVAVWGYCINDVIVTLAGTRSGSTIDMTGTVDGVTIQVVGVLSSDSETFEGTYTYGGGSCGGSHPPQSMLGQHVHVGGTWSDEYVTLELVDTIPGYGAIPLSGVATFNNDTCFPSGTVSNITRGRLVFPDVANGSNRYLINAEISRDGQEMVYYYWPDRGSCDGFGGGTLTRR